MENDVKKVNEDTYKVVKNQPKPKDLLAPWHKISLGFEIGDPTELLFTRYVAFYLNVITSGDDNGYITTNIIMLIAEKLKMKKDSTEDCIKGLMKLNMLFKIKRGLYQINQKHLNKKQSVVESNAIIEKQKKNIPQVNIQNNYYGMSLKDILLTKHEDNVKRLKDL